ncbi:MAG: hypothetical protein HQL87_16595 [Magnetococcales bacterium]|nr:hypothetical protein [Magnetococcales bacterium]
MSIKSFIFLLTCLLVMQTTPVFSDTENKGSEVAATHANLAGLWTGRWTGSVFGGDVSLSINQSSSHVSGTLTLGLACFPSGSVSGTIKGNSFQMTVVSADDSVLIYSGSLSSENVASGSWTQQSGTCPLPNGQWALSRNL